MTARLAYNLTRRDAVYRHASFSAGLRASGFEVGAGVPRGRPGDVLLIWNRYGQYDEEATRFEAAGGAVIVAENGYLMPGGGSPHDKKDRQWYALGAGSHNDSGAVPGGDGSRWASLGLDLAPWREAGRHVLVCPNRSFGMPDRMMPVGWGADAVKRLQKLTKREIRLRPHPGNEPPKKPLSEDLAGAWAVVIWCSSAGVHALVAGIPVICFAPHWICKGAAGKYPGDIGSPPMPDRLPAMQRMAWGQWHLSEIENGTAFAHVLRRTEQAEVAAGA